MQIRSRTDRLVRILLTTAMVWGFAVPIVHLACATAATDITVLCDEHEATSHESAAMGHHDATATAHLGHAPDVVIAGEMEASDALLECCLFEAAALEHRASLVNVTAVPSPVADPVDAPIAIDPPAIVPRVESDSSPPVAFQLLFSVFLI